MLRWVDGQPYTELPLGDRGLAYGDGLFETIAVRHCRSALLPRHLARLSEGARRLSLNLDLALVEHELEAFCAALGEGVAKLIVTRGDSQRGYAIAADATPRRILQGAPLPAYPATHAVDGVRLFPCATRLAEQSLLAGLKHLNRLEQVLARSEWQSPDCAEGLMRDVSGRVVEGVFSNLFLVCAGVLVTPLLTRCGVAGVMREEILAQAQALGIPAQQRDVRYDELAQADEVFMCNSLYGIWPVRQLEHLGWPVGPLTRKLQAIIRSRLDS